MMKIIVADSSCASTSYKCMRLVTAPIHAPITFVFVRRPIRNSCWISPNKNWQNCTSRSPFSNWTWSSCAANATRVSMNAINFGTSAGDRLRISLLQWRCASTARTQRRNAWKWTDFTCPICWGMRASAHTTTAYNWRRANNCTQRSRTT